MCDDLGQEVERVEILPQFEDGRWQPVVGEAAYALLNRLRAADRGDVDTVQNEAVDVLSRCVCPSAESGDDTGIVIGYVQSGKTMSFTVVAALARDNGYGMVVVITGTSRNLFRQSTERLRADLEIRGANSRWVHVENPSSANIATVDSMSSSLAFWRDHEAPPALRRTILVTVMKHHSHLNNLISVLERCRLDGVPVLVIDDEADQAGLNTLVSRGDESPTHSCLAALRNCLPHHTYLQYTATPQAPLLISLIDALSPSFVAVVTPGPDYTGGPEFFDDDSHVVRPIPLADVPSPNNVITEPTQSLMAAMRSYLIGVAAQLVQAEAPGPRSMLVHPSATRAVHTDYETWARSIRRRWLDELSEAPDHPDFIHTRQQFREAYDDLSETVATLPPFDEIMGVMRYAVQATTVQTINSASGITPEPEWGHSQILVGGRSLERGVTVEGLTVSYMPRGAGGGNADTIQQRARWFGYKADYIGFCRVHLPPDVVDVYRAYIEHEEGMRRDLRNVQEDGSSLSEWRRRFFLDPNLQPTRRNVIGLDYMRGDFAGRWFRQEAPHKSDGAISSNRRLRDDLGARLEFQERRWGRAASHQMADDQALAEIYANLLVPFKIPEPSESFAFQGLLLQLARHLENEPNERCCVYLMRPGIGTRRALQNGKVNQLFQGRGGGYPGDSELRDRDTLTVQVHAVTLLNDNGDEVVADAPALAVWVPRRMSQAWLVQVD